MYEITKEYPREYKYTLGQDMKRDVMELIRCIYRANKARDKRENLEDFLDKFELLKLEIRVSFDFKLLSVKRFSEISAIMESISKQITGWKQRYDNV